MVFVALWSLPSASWAYQMLALFETGFRRSAYDRYGHSCSDDPGRGFDLDTLADDLAGAMEALDPQFDVITCLVAREGDPVPRDSLIQDGRGPTCRRVTPPTWREATPLFLMRFSCADHAALVGQQ